jgi:FAD-dependent urate hydroxylase
MTLVGLLHQRGVEPVVIEREESFGTGGYMLGLYPIGSRVLRGLGLYDTYLSRGVSMQTYRICDGRGHLVHEYDLTPITDRFGPILGIQRGALLEVLREGSGQTEIRFGTTVSALSSSQEGVSVTFSDGTTQSFDLVVGADGLHSSIRDLTLEEGEFGYFETGWGGWVYWVDTDLAPLDTYTEYWGAGYFLGIYPTPEHLGVFLGGDLEKIDRGDPASAHETVATSIDSPVLAAPLPEPDEAFFWDFHDCRTSRWHDDRVILLGDAATGFLPTAGVGASMAIESAAVLDDVLSRCGPEGVPEALAMYEQRHRSRVESAQSASRRLSRYMFVSNSAMARLRDGLVRHYSLEQLVRSVAGLMEQPA